MPLCRLCAQEIYDDDLAYLHEENSVDTTMIVDKINACLPISVSKTHIIKYILCILLDLVANPKVCIVTFVPVIPLQLHSISS